MKTPLTTIALLVTSLIFLSACGSDSSGGGGGDQGQVVHKLGLKTPGAKKVLVGSVRDLRTYLVNYDNASYAVGEGADLVRWDASAPKLFFEKAGQVRVFAVDSKDQTAVEIQFKVTFDATEIGSGPGIGEEEIELPETPIVL